MRSLLIALILLLSCVTEANAQMKVFWQWAKSTPGDWVLGNSSNFGSGPKKADPVGDVNSITQQAVGDSLLNNQNGWILALNIQGVIFEGADHFAVEDLNDGSNGIRVTVWFDDPVWFPVGSREAHVWTFLPLAVQPGVGLNTVQSRVIYCESALCVSSYTGIENTTVTSWSNFITPSSAVTKHGIWLSDSKWNEHIAARTLHGWREWTE